MTMFKRIRTTAGALVVLGALSLGGSAIASATKTTHRLPAPSHNTRAAHIANTTEPKGVETDAPGGANVESGDQTTPDSVATAADTSSTIEPAGTEADGPGGHQDPAGANVDHQFEGQE